MPTPSPIGDIKKYQVEKSIANFMLNIPEVKLSYKIEYAKDFLDKRTIDASSEPDILKVALRSFGSGVTVVETNLMAKVILVGFGCGRVQAFYFYEESSKDVDLDRVSYATPSNLQTILETDVTEAADGIRECTFLGHNGAVTCLSMSYDSFYFVSGSADCSVRLWSLKMGHCLAIFKAHVSPVWSVKLNPKGFHFASGGADSLIFLWLTNRSKFGSLDNHLMSFTQHQKEITCLEFTENQNYLVSTSLDRSLRIWSLDDASLIRVIFFPEPIRTFKLTMNADVVVCGGDEGGIYVWNLIKPSKVHSFSYFPGKPVQSIRMSTDERFVLISAGNRATYFMTNHLKEEKSISAFEGFYGRPSNANWQDLALNSLEFPSSKIALGTVGSRNTVYLVTQEN